MGYLGKTRGFRCSSSNSIARLIVGYVKFWVFAEVGGQAGGATGEVFKEPDVVIRVCSLGEKSKEDSEDMVGFPKTLDRRSWRRAGISPSAVSLTASRMVKAWLRCDSPYC